MTCHDSSVTGWVPGWVREVQMVNEREVTPQNGDPLLRLVQRDGTFWVRGPGVQVQAVQVQVHGWWNI